MSECVCCIFSLDSLLYWLLYASPSASLHSNAHASAGTFSFYNSLLFCQCCEVIPHQYSRGFRSLLRGLLTIVLMSQFIFTSASWHTSFWAIENVWARTAWSRGTKPFVARSSAAAKNKTVVWVGHQSTDQDEVEDGRMCCSSPTLEGHCWWNTIQILLYDCQQIRLAGFPFGTKHGAPGNTPCWFILPIYSR